MSINKLYLFAKDTDASYGVRGFQYQIVKTLSTWLRNYLNQVDEVIYCDYEEDIFQRNESSRHATFRQVKLYATNFSFKSEEVEKAIAHFFMLHVSSNYQDWDKRYVFEASSGVAAKRGDNEADLLRRWVASQDSLMGPLLTDCTAKVKQFVTSYVKTQAAYLTGQVDSTLIADALAVLPNIQQEEWERFTSSIRWEFAESDDPGAEFAAAQAEVRELIKELPFDLSESRCTALNGILHNVVSMRTADPSPAERALTATELEHHILASGTEQEQWYLNVYEKWQAASTNSLYPGEILEVISGANFCRWSPNLGHHDEFWLRLLQIYIEDAHSLPDLQQIVLYEYLFLVMRPTSYYTPPTGTMQGREDYVRRYFQDFSSFRDPIDFEQAQCLLLLVVGAYKLRRAGIGKSELLGWLRQYRDTLDKVLSQAATPSSRRCRLLVCQIFNLTFQLQPDTVAEVIGVLRPLIAALLVELPQAAHFNVTIFSDQLDIMALQLAEAGVLDYEPLVEELREINEQLGPYVEQRSGAHRRAKALVASGAKYLQQNNPLYKLYALRDFHRAKDLWNTKEATKGFLLALRQIALLYQSLGLNLAAKYYALGAAWVGAHSDEGKLLDQVPEALAMVLHADFQQGAWLGVMADFEAYIKLRISLDPQPLDLQAESAVLHTVSEYALVVYTAPLISSSFNILVQQQVAALPNDVRESLVVPFLAAYQERLTTAVLPDHLTSQLTDAPLSDAGGERTIQFRALGSRWRITFITSYRMVSIAEEFVAHLQILLAEIALSKADFHLPKGEVVLRLVEDRKWREPKRQPSNQYYTWDVALRYFDSPDPEQIKRTTASVSAALMTVLDEISLLKKEEFREAFTSLFEKAGLANKTLFANAYQRMYRYFMSPKRYNALRHKNFASTLAFLLPSLPAENEALKWKQDLSLKYDQAQSLRHICGRFYNHSRLIGITLERIKREYGYDEWLQQLREAGYLDWQITHAVMNCAISYKANHQLQNKQFASEKEHIQALEEVMGQLMRQDEQDYYVTFPLEAFKGKEFKDQLILNSSFVLASYGLENKSQTPNFEAIRELLTVRFNMQTDTTEEGNPLRQAPESKVALAGQLLEKTWKNARSLRLVAPDVDSTDIAGIALMFKNDGEGLDGYEVLRDLFQDGELTAMLHPEGGKLTVSITENTGAAIKLPNLAYRSAEFANFQALVSLDKGLVFLVGTEQEVADYNSAVVVDERSIRQPFMLKGWRLHH